MPIIVTDTERPTLRFKTYAENVRVTAKELGLSIRDLANYTQYGYEHIRRILKGEQHNVSRDCNDLLCEAVGLDADAMWDLIEREKYAEKHGYATPTVIEPLLQELLEVWETLDQEQKLLGLRMLKGLAAERLLAAS
jgi:hypothetical protein